MEQNAIVTEEVMDNMAEGVTEEIVQPKSKVSFGKVAVKVGLAALAGFGIYKGVKCLVAKVKAKKAKKEEEVKPEVVEEPEEEVKLIYDDNGNPIED